jgi:hypothetical protein
VSLEARKLGVFAKGFNANSDAFIALFRGDTNFHACLQLAGIAFLAIATNLCIFRQGV